jgi:subtilisin family serine protease
MVASLGGTVASYHPGTGFAVVDGLASVAAARLAGERGVQAVEPDVVSQIVDPAFESAPALAGELDVGIASRDNPAAATLFAFQWHHRAIRAHTAWAAGFLGSPSVKVAILDSGIDGTHQELAGLIDAGRSRSFVATGSTDPLNPSDDQLLDAFFPGSGRPAWSDLNGHGTFTAATVSSNAIRAAGVTSKVTLIAVKVMNARGAGSILDILNGILHATDVGADVINMSLGAVASGHGGYIGFLNRITGYARSRGVTIVVASGNEAIDLDHSGGVYAAFCSSGMVICVSATGPLYAPIQGPYGDVDRPATYSTIGTSSVDVAAPGGNFETDAQGNVIPASISWVWAACSSTQLLFLDDPDEEGDEHYVKTSCTTSNRAIAGGVGTSASAPHVAGLAALLVERFGRSPGAIRTLIQDTADDLGKSGVDPRYGKGRINVARALGLIP